MAAWPVERANAPSQPGAPFSKTRPTMPLSAAGGRGLGAPWVAGEHRARGALHCVRIQLGARGAAQATPALLPYQDAWRVAPLCMGRRARDTILYREGCGVGPCCTFCMISYIPRSMSPRAVPRCADRVNIAAGRAVFGASSRPAGRWRAARAGRRGALPRAPCARGIRSGRRFGRNKGGRSP